MTMKLTYLQVLILFARTLSASITISPEMIALVVAMAGMMFPASAKDENVRPEEKKAEKRRIEREGLHTFSIKSAFERRNQEDVRSKI